MKGALLAAGIIMGVASATPALAQSGPLAEVKVDVNEDAQPVGDVLRRLEERHGLNYVLNDAASGAKVTVRLRGVPLDAALQAICSAAGLQCEFHGPLVVVTPRTPGARPPLPTVEQGVLPDSRPAQPDPTSDASPPPARADEPLQAMGKLEEVDLENRRIQLRIDGVKRDFYLPTSGEGLQVSRLESAINSLKPGSRVAFLYRREEGGRSVITDLIGGTRQPRSRTRPAAAPRGDVAPIESDDPVDERQVPFVPAPAEPSAPPVPEVPPARDGKAPIPMPEGVIAGKLVSRDNDLVRIRRGDGEVFDLHLPPESADNERRARVVAAIEALRPDDQLLVTYEDKDGVRYIKDTITGRAR